jgi:hypothetical protein
MRKLNRIEFASGRPRPLGASVRGRRPVGGVVARRARELVLSLWALSALAFCGVVAVGFF